MSTATKSKKKLPPANSDGSWTCPGCGVASEAWEPACCHGCDELRPDLPWSARFLLAAADATEGQHLIWRRLRFNKATDAELAEGLRLACGADQGDVEHVDLGIVAWELRPDHGGPAIWHDTERTGPPDMAGAVVLQTLRELFGIREPAPGMTSTTTPAGIARLSPHAEERPSLKKAAEAAVAGERSVPLAKIVTSELNPRVIFDEVKLQELADSLKVHGQLQNLVVYPHPRIDGQYELIAGERRYRAGKLAGLVEMRCQVLDCTEAQAIELRGIENLQREDLSAIEHARWYQQMLDRCGYTQEKLAERLGCSQPTIANRIRLLKLPDAWQDRVIRREISESHARELAPWADLPAVLETLAETLADEFEGEAPSLLMWKEAIGDALYHVSRPVKGWFNHRDGEKHYSGDAAFTPAALKKWGVELELRDVPHRYAGGKSTELRAFNVPRWWELQQDLAAKAEARQAARRGGPVDVDDEAGPAAGVGSPSEAERRREAQRKKERAAEILESRITDYRRAWLQRAIAARMVDRKRVPLETLLKILVWRVHSHEMGQETAVMDAVVECGGKLSGEQRWHCQLPPIVAAADAETLARTALAGVMSRIYQLNELDQLAELTDVDLARDWRVDQAFLELHSAEQLQRLRDEWAIPSNPAKLKRPELIEQTLAAAQAADRLGPAVRAPKSLAPAKAKSLAPAKAKKGGKR